MKGKPAAVPRTREWLNGSERDRLRELEDLVERGLRVAVSAGKALLEIRDSRLYRESGGTFEEYCRQRFGLSRKRAYDFIALVQVQEIVSPNGDSPVPASEAVARELAPLRDDPDGMREVWGEAVQKHGPEPTAEQVREVRSPPNRADTRFDYIEDAVALLRLLPAVEAIVWPTEPGDVEVIGEELAWLAGWAPVANRAFRRYRREQRRPRAVA